MQAPIVQAGMGGRLAAAELAGAVSVAGGLGTIGILGPAQLRAEIAAALELLDARPLYAGECVSRIGTSVPRASSCAISPARRLSRDAAVASILRRRNANRVGDHRHAPAR
jgi:NAD(P)H-dependent flavin oxidoreductase YrpB (nitropropane dioxygenase family)